MTTKLVEFCRIKNNALSDKICDDIIKLFNDHTELHERYDNDKKPNFTQFNFTKNKHLNLNLHKEICELALQCIDEYKKTVPETEYWPPKYSFEEFRIKHYKGDSIDQFDTHVDAISNSTAKRFFVFFWYLNDVEEGGETEFPFLAFKIKPKKGSLFMFPPMWLYPHSGKPVIKGEKFLLSSYLHYGE